ncbi:MAG: hypothetical protein IJ400_00050 [Clostridia bacterium]|nr:hypothetical protein [Clostridia bacterium]
MKKCIKYLLGFIGIYFILYFLAPLFGVSDLSEYTQELYWLEILICEMVVFMIYIYFQEINPRRHVMIFVEKNIKSSIAVGIVSALCFMVWFAIGMVIVILIPDSIMIKLVLTILWFFVFLVFLYLFFYRGVSVYKNKKIRVFNLKVVTYHNGLIENIQIENLGKISKLNVVINGKDNVFWVSSKSAEKYMSQLLKLRNI